MAQQVIDAKDEVNRLASEAEIHLARRLTAEANDRLALYRIETEIIEYLKRVYYFAKRIAKTIAQEEETGQVDTAAHPQKTPMVSKDEPLA
jgi:phosphate:Na+ symporter